MSIDNREYTIVIDPRILELLGPSLYTNIYYILAELIANAYDANASNVYIIQKEDRIIVEDDGEGMSYSGGDIRKYLDVAVETRTSSKDVYVKGTKRKKMGRKGVGKLAALSVSDEVLVMTKKGNEYSGFVLSTHVNEDHKLDSIPEEDIKFERIREHGTSIVMTNPKYDLHRTSEAIKNNLLKIFPLVGSDFKIHIITPQAELVVDNFDKEMIKQLGALVLLGDDFHHLSENFDSHLESKETETNLLKKRPIVVETISMLNKFGEQKDYKLEIKGWIGAYRSTSGRKIDRHDFPDNFISLLSNGKLGEYNILPTAGKNKLAEVYIVGQLHIDLLEETELPDMALSNRQGYKTDDPRYNFVLSFVRDSLLPEVVELRTQYGVFRKNEMDKGKIEKEKTDEANLRKSVDEYKKEVSEQTAKRMQEKLKLDSPEDLKRIIEAEMNSRMPDLGLKRKIDAQKKKILISHASEDKALSDLVCKMLIFNNVPEEDIIYTSSENEDCRVPEGQSLLDYLRDFFVDSYSTEKIFIIYVTSETMVSKWHPVIEVGAMWITQNNHKIFNIEGAHSLKPPLDVLTEYHVSKVDSSKNISMSQKEFDKFAIKIIDICNKLGYKHKDKDKNKEELNRYIKVTS